MVSKPRYVLLSSWKIAMQSEKIIIAQQNLVAVNRQAAAEGIVLLENKNATLPLKVGEKISLFGRCQIDTYRSGTGSGGAVNVPYAISALQGLRCNSSITINETLVSVYEQWIAEHPFDDGGGGWAAEPWFQQEMPLSQTLIEQAVTHSDKALVFIGRTAGEDQDNANAAGSYQLTADEINLIEQVNSAFECVIIVLNVTNIMDMSWLHSIKNNASIHAVLYSWAAGMEGGHALADILCGDRSPSGRLTDTIAYQLNDYPSAANFGRSDFNLYQEDIYVGYRYFETFHPQAVQYAFGAGLSYTQFKRTMNAFSITGDGVKQVLHFDIKVENSGALHSSKEVVQLYAESPQGELGKPARTLVGFAKTITLNPGESEIVHIAIPIHRLASFDDNGATGNRNCYLLEAGCYQFYLGGSVREATRISASLVLAQPLITETLQEALAPITPFERLKPGCFTEDGFYQASYEAAPQRTVSLTERIQNNLPPCHAITADRGITLADVAQGEASLSDFVAQMSCEQLATLIRGEGMCSAKVTPGSAAAFGGVSDSLFNLGIPVLAAADGPSGIRMDSGHQATQVPIGTLLGCSWNSVLNEQLFYLIGQELKANNIDTLLGPGLNIHRHPLNGRNFEYFSEDPLLSGVIGAAQTRALQAAGVSGTIKHFAANDQETARVDVDAIASQRALREIHLKPFEIAVKTGRASTMMTSYNPINGHWAASNYDLNSTILRGEWGYTGIVMTDWWAKMNCPIRAGEAANTFTSFMIRAQNDLYMVVENDGAENNSMHDDTLAALQKGTLTIGELQRCARNICRLIIASAAMKRPLQAYQPIQAFIANNALADTDAIAIESNIQLDSGSNISLVIAVAEAGIYQCNAIICYDRDALAQSSCSLSINGTFSMSLGVNGTGGKSQTVEGLQIALEVGLYQLDINFVKVGLILQTLTFIKQ